MFTNSKGGAVHEHARVRYFELGIIQYVYKSKNPGEDSGHSLGIVNRSIKTLIAEGYLDESIQPTQKAIEILYNFTKDTKKYNLERLN